MIWGGSDPVPTSIPMLSQSPNIIQSCQSKFPRRAIMIFLSLFPAPEDDHHTECWPFFTNSCWVVDSCTWNDLVWKLIFLPTKRAFEDVEQPDVILCLVAWITTENHDVRLVEDHGVTVSLSRGTIFIGDFDDAPDRTTYNVYYSFLRSKI